MTFSILLPNFNIQPAFAADTCTSSGAGDWNTISWSCGHTPTTGDSVVIDHDVTIGSYTIAQIADLTVNAAKTLTQNNTNTQTITGTLTVNGTLNHGDNTTTHAYEVDFVAANSTIGGSGLINVDAKGFDGGTRATGSGTGAGVGSNSGEIGAGGAGYGGAGGAGDDLAGGAVYGSVTAPVNLGSGGGGANFGGATTIGGAGGGLVILNITGTLTMTSGAVIKSTGGNSGCSDDGGGGGSGGSIYITAGTMSGTGTISSNGGNGGGSCSNDDGGAGGGGRISLVVTNTISGTITKQSYAGTSSSQVGGAGTIYTSESGTTTLLADNNLSPSSLTSALTSQISGASISVNNVTIKGGARYKIISGTSLTMTASAFGATSTMASIENEGTLTLPATFSIPANLIMIADNDGTINTLNNLTVDASGTFTLENYLNDPASEAFSIATLTVNGTLNHTANSSAGSTKTHTVNISSTTITVGSTGSINADAKGFSGGTRGDGTGPGKGLGGSSGELGASGAGYGGIGGAGDDYAAGSTYGSATAPVDLGSGGGGPNFGGTTTIGGHGGGAIKLVVSGTLTVTTSGTIRSNGGSSGCSDDGGGGGSGGSIYITTGTIGGGGTMTTTGGNGGTNCGADDGGGGGGGRIYVGYATSTFTEASATSAGGTGGTSGSGNANAGTVTFEVLTPTASTTLYSANTDASAGSANPVDLTTLTPVFSALCDTPTGQCTLAEIEVSANADFSSPSWQSGQLNIADINDGVRSANITYAGSQLVYNTTYYWRIKFHNANGAGAWSTETATFYVPHGLELYSLNYGGSIQGGQAVNILWGSTGGPAGETIKLEYSTNDFSSATTIDASEASDGSASTVRSYSWTVPSANTLCGASSCAGVKIRVSSNTDGNTTKATTESGFTVQGDSVTSLKTGRTYGHTGLYTESADLTYSGGNAVYAGGTWYNSSWLRRTPVTVTNNVASTLTNYQVRVAVTYDSDMQADFDDIRFTSSDKTTLVDHWLETKVDSTSAVFWVEVPTIASSSTATLYMYYGNSGASSASSINNTFLAGDNFDGATLDAEWTEVTAGGASAGTFSSGKWSKTCNGACDWWSSDDLDSGAYITDPTPTSTWEAVTFMSATTSITNSHLGMMLYEGARDGYLWGYKNDAGSISYKVDITGTAAACTISNTTTSAYLKIVKTTGNGLASNNTFKFYRGDDSGTWTQCGTYAPSDIMSKVGLFVKDWGTGSISATYDFFFVKQYTTTEPTSSVGSEESYGATTTDQTIVFAAGHTFTSVNTFAATTSGDGTIKFQISADNGSNWKYCVGDTLTTATDGYTHANTAAEVTNNCLASLTAGTFNVRAYIRSGVGQTTTLSDISFNVVTNTAPTASAISPSQTSASLVTFTTTVADTDLNTTSLSVEYSRDNSTWSSATLGTVTQGGGEGNGVSTGAGSITGIDTNSDGSVDLTINWAASTDIPNIDDTTVYLRIVPNDGVTNGSTATSSSFAVDTLNPTAHGNLSVNSVTTSTVVLTFGAATTETNFDAYKIFYKAGASGVTTSDTAFTTANDSDLDLINYNGTTTTTVSSLSANTQYVFKIWAYDTFSNSTPSSGEVATYTLANVPSAPTLTTPSSTSLNIVINQNSNPSNTEYAIKVGSNYIQANGSLSGSEAWQSYATWGGATGQTISSLSVNTQYTVSVKARNGSTTETALSSESSLYTLANVPSAPTLTTPSSTSLNIVINQNSNPSTVEYAIKVGSNYIQADGSLNSSEAWQSYTTWGGATGQTISSLSVNTQYTVSVKARNTNSTATALSSETSLYTLANVPSAPTISSPSSTSLNIIIGQNSNPSTTEYAIKVGSNYIQANGSLSGSEAWQSYATWGGASGQTISSLSVNTQYTISVKARNTNSTATALSSETSLYTLANVPSAPTVTAPSSTSLNIVVNENSNPSTTEYAIKVGSSYIQEDGSLNVTEAWQTYTNWGGLTGETITGLSPNIQYAVSVKARSGSSTSTALSSESSKYTLANPPSTLSALMSFPTSVNLSWLANSNPDGTEYYVEGISGSTANSGWITVLTWSDTTATSRGVSYCYRAKAKNGDGVETDLVLSNCASEAQPVAAGGGGSSATRNATGSSRSTPSNTTVTKPTESVITDQNLIEIPEDVKTTEESLEITAKNAGSPDPIEIINEDEKMRLFIPEQTDILTGEDQNFVGKISPPSPLITPPVIPNSLIDNIVASLSIKTTASNSQATNNEEVYFSKPVIITLTLDETKFSDPSNLLAYYYNESEKKYEYVSSLVISADKKTAAFITYHLSTFVVFELSESERITLQNGTSLKDIQGHWAKDYITLLFNAGIVNGKANDKFMPNSPITRAEFVKIALLASDNSKLESTYVDFKDVPSTHWATYILSTAQKAAIITTYPDKTFRPDRSITRAEALKILILAAKIDLSLSENIPDAKFTDLSDDLYTPYINYATHNGIIKGYSDGTFKPLKSITRAEASKLVVELMMK